MTHIRFNDLPAYNVCFGPTPEPKQEEPVFFSRSEWRLLADTISNETTDSDGPWARVLEVLVRAWEAGIVHVR